jgi:hypothetical protein
MLKGEVDDLRASVYCQMATCKRDLKIDRDFRLGIGANQLLGVQSTLSQDEASEPERGGETSQNTWRNNEPTSSTACT